VEVRSESEDKVDRKRVKGNRFLSQSNFFNGASGSKCLNSRARKDTTVFDIGENDEDPPVGHEDDGRREKDEDSSK
jgi:hypothetical protein